MSNLPNSRKQKNETWNFNYFHYYLKRIRVLRIPPSPPFRSSHMSRSTVRRLTEWAKWAKPSRSPPRHPLNPQHHRRPLDGLIPVSSAAFPDSRLHRRPSWSPSTPPHPSSLSTPPLLPSSPNHRHRLPEAPHTDLILKAGIRLSAWVLRGPSR
jgi:hypothetical protein